MNKLTGKIQHYAWGGIHYIPQLLNVDNTQNKPFAEYWMGAHNSSPSVIETGEILPVPLNLLIKEDAEKWLGHKVMQQFDGLPYLLKVLDVKDMLSIQVHPSKTEAERGYARENEAGIPVNAPERNYKDDNHKPEVMVALSEFWLLHGFKEKSLLQQTLQQVNEFNSLLPLFEEEGYAGLYKYVMELPQHVVDNILQPLIKKTEPSYKANQLSKSEPAYRADKTVGANGGNLINIDRGIFSIYFFNILQLHPGQAIFQGAGVPHAYLEGQNIELMSNSDNVLRGGLTPKHIDVPELLKLTLFEGIIPQVMNGTRNGMEILYHCPIPDFIVSKIELSKETKYDHTAFSAEILLLTEGSADVVSGEQKLHVKKGESCIICAGESYTVTASTATIIFKAGVPG